MSGDCHTGPAEPNKEQLTQRYGAKVASKLLSIDADIRLLYKRAVDSVGQDAAQIARLAEPLCQYVAEAEMQRRRRRWQRLMLCFAAVTFLLLGLVACETSYNFFCAVARILWIKVDYLVSIIVNVDHLVSVIVRIQLRRSLILQLITIIVIIFTNNSSDNNNSEW